MNELYQVHDTHGRPKIADNIYCFQLPSQLFASCHLLYLFIANYLPFTVIQLPN